MITINSNNMIYWILAALAVTAIGASASINNQASTQENVLAPNVITFDEDEFKEMRQTEADGVYNIVKNMEAGYVTPSKAHDDIFDIKFYAKEYTTGSAVEAEVNHAYIGFLDSALDCTNQFQYGINSDEYQKVYGEMMAKKELI